MRFYSLKIEEPAGRTAVQQLAFDDDDAAICYALPLARGRLLEIWRQDKLVATVDERPY